MFGKLKVEIHEVYKGKENYTISLRLEKFSWIRKSKCKVSFITIIGSKGCWRYFPSFFEVEPWMIDQFDAAFLRWQHKNNVESGLRGDGKTGSTQDQL